MEEENIKTFVLCFKVILSLCIENSSTLGLLNFTTVVERCRVVNLHNFVDTIPPFSKYDNPDPLRLNYLHI